MKRLILIVKPFKLDAVLQALLEEGARAVTVMEARGYGRQKGHLDLYREEPQSVTFLPKARVECVIEDAALEKALRRAGAAARTGRIGDGKILVENLAGTEQEACP